MNLRDICRQDNLLRGTPFFSRKRIRFVWSLMDWFRYSSSHRNVYRNGTMTKNGKVEKATNSSQKPKTEVPPYHAPPNLLHVCSQWLTFSPPLLPLLHPRSLHRRRPPPKSP